MPITYGDAVSKTNHRSPIVAAYDVVAGTVSGYDELRKSQGHRPRLHQAPRPRLHQAPRPRLHQAPRQLDTTLPATELITEPPHTGQSHIEFGQAPATPHSRAPSLSQPANPSY